MKNIGKNNFEVTTSGLDLNKYDLKQVDDVVDAFEADIQKKLNELGLLLEKGDCITFYGGKPISRVKDVIWCYDIPDQPYIWIVFENADDTID